MYQQPSERAQESLGGTPGHFLNTLFVGTIAAAAAGVAVWLFAFGGLTSVSDLPDRLQFSSSPPWLVMQSAHQDVADSAVLTLGDLPSGWVIPAEDDEDDEDIDFDHEISEGCKQFVGEDPFPGSVARAESPNMDGPDRQSVHSEAYVFAGAGEAEASLARQREAVAQCGDDLRTVFEAAFRHGLEQGGAQPDQVEVQSAVEDLGSPNVGESGMMFRVRFNFTGPAGSVELAMDFITFRHGRMVGNLSYMTVGGLRSEEEQQIAQAAAAKLQAANAMLPQT
jgi:hypothetical protein